MVEGIKARLGREKGSWVEELPHALWAHRTMPKTKRGDTIQPDVWNGGYDTCRDWGRTLQGEKGDEEDLRLNLNLAKERREEAARREAEYKKKIEKYYNARVRKFKFKIGDLVLRKNEATSRKEDQGKLRSKWEGPYQVTWPGDKGDYKLTDLAGKEIPRTWNSMQLRKYYA
ncbi:uncharacterized protein LOC143633023 [Bidens hawaiensis]|uniref:uncharacterized protein LOC143633023 n=1 Tax=Bidens hawaiensis TaxID=980011 RepID=UPI00404909CB